MAKFMVTIPLPAGNKDKFVQFAAQALGPRRAEHDGSRARLGITEERCWVQDTPGGGQLFTLYLVGRDPVAGNRRFAASDDEYDLWFKREGGPLIGVDLGQPIPVVPQLVYESAPPSRTGAQAVALALPVLDPQRWDGIVAEVNGPRHAANAESNKRLGVTEDWYLEPTPDGAGLVLLYLESDDLAAGIGAFADSTEAHDVWLKAEVLAATGVDWNQPQPGPLPELVMDWQAG